MNPEKKRESWWVVPIFVVLSPLIVAVLLLWLLYSVALYLLIWVTWITRERDILFVYSDSPHWKNYIEEEILPRIKNRAVVLNWSDRHRWLGSFALAPMVFRHFGGYREFNPMAIQFRLLRLHRCYRFWEPIRKWRKKDDKKDLDDLLTRFYSETKT